LAVQGLPSSGVCYAVRVAGSGGWDTGYRWDKSRLLLDPRAPLVAGRKAWGKRDAFEEFQQEVRGGQIAGMCGPAVRGWGKQGAITPR
jgi:isoamylase